MIPTPVWSSFCFLHCKISSRFFVIKDLVIFSLNNNNIRLCIDLLFYIVNTILTLFSIIFDFFTRNKTNTTILKKCHHHNIRYTGRVNKHTIHNAIAWLWPWSYRLTSSCQEDILLKKWSCALVLFIHDGSNK